MAIDPLPQVAAALDRIAGGEAVLALAVSGGSDSTALLHLTADWAARQAVPPRLMVATVDHGLRDGSGAEAEAVARACAALGLPHQTLRWQRPAGAGNLMAQARDGRRRLLGGWAAGAPVLLGHTRDDQAETLLMRLLRGAGVDGLSAMAEARRDAEGRWMRPLLQVSRDDLRAWLTARGIGWTDDPSNDRRDFDRVRVRQALATLALDPAALAASAAHLAEARDVLNAVARQAAAGATARLGVLHLPRAALAAPTLPETRRRVLAAAIRWVTGAAYVPRGPTLGRALAALAEGRPASLGGVLLRPQAEGVTLAREAARTAPLWTAGGEAVWDGRWRLTGLPPGARVEALGDRLSGLRRSAGLSHLEAAALPAVALPDGRLLAPALEPMAGVAATPLRGAADLFPLLSH